MLNRSTGAKSIGFVILFALFIWWLRSYRIAEYRGDGKITDAGTWNFPRYRVELGPIPFCGSSIHQFKLSGLPSDQMTLRLMIVGKTEKDRAELTRLKTRIEASLVDNKGHIVCTAIGIPSDGIQKNAWILTSSDTSAALYNQACVDVDVQRGRSYSLTVSLIAVDSDLPKTYLVPILSGGGNELP